MLRLLNFVLLLAPLTIHLSANNAAISTALQAMMYLANYGYLDPVMLNNISSTALVPVSNEAYRRGLAEFQSFVGLNRTGDLDEKTLEWMNKPRCGVRDREFKTSATNSSTRSKRYSVEVGNRWTTKHLTYDIKEYTSKLNSSEVDHEIDRAFKFWENVSSLTFKRARTGPVDIEIRFVKKKHECKHVSTNEPNKQDLAHAFSPNDGGGVHFYEDVEWTIDSREGNNLLYAAVHEFGHSLGLFHSHNRLSVMFCKLNKEYDPHFKLHKDDIDGIQHLYGKNKNSNVEHPDNFDSNLDKEFIEMKTQLAETKAIVEDLKTKLNEATQKNSEMKTHLAEMRTIVDDFTTKLNEGTRKSVDIGHIPTSCEDLKQTGNTLNGVFLVKRSNKMETIYCDFSSNGKKLETRIGFVDVKSAPTYFYVTRNNTFSSAVGPIPFDFAIVNEGDAMDLKTGKFTAPKTGIYFFSFTGMADFPQSSSLLRLGIGFFLNGNQIGRSFVDEANSVKWQKSQLTFQSTIFLKEGDQVWVQIIIIGPGVSLYDNEWHYTHFTGFILDENISL